MDVGGEGIRLERDLVESRMTGSGSVSDAQLIESVYTQAYP